MTTRPLLAIAAATLCLAAAPAALADEFLPVESKRVSLAGLDPSAPADAPKIYRRLRHAAKDVCAYASAPRAYSSACVAQALDASVAQLNQPAVDALHRLAPRG